MANILYNYAKKYTEFEIAGKKVKIPYVLAKGKRWHFLQSSGKGSPQQIKAETIRRAKNRGVALNFLSNEKISQFMRREGIGIDCSGLVYNLLDTFLKETKGLSLASCLIRYPGFLGRVEKVLLYPYRVRRISSQTLTSDLNTVKIERVSLIEVGDLIKLTPVKWPRAHVAIIVEKSPHDILYVHSSRDTKERGPHFGKIEIHKEDEVLEKQSWLEVTKAGENYGQRCYKIENGDSVRRLKCLL